MSNRPVDQRRQEYDRAQRLGERVERMCNEEGWKEHFIPMIQKKRNEAQAIINDFQSDERITDLNRGLLQAYDLVLGYEQEKKQQATSIMRKNATAKIQDGDDPQHPSRVRSSAAS